MIDPIHLHADVFKAEGCRLTAYRDSLGYWTLGVGHLLVPVDHDWSGETCTEQQAEEWLNNDLAEAERQATTLPEWLSLNTPCRQNAITELVFNLGLQKWLLFTKTRASLSAQDWGNAATQLLQSHWATQVGPTRSQRIHDYILRGVYPNGS